MEHVRFIAMLIFRIDALVGTILSYVFYWIAVIVTLIVLKYKEVTWYNKMILFNANETFRVAPNSLATSPLPVLVVRLVVLRRQQQLTTPMKMTPI